MAHIRINQQGVDHTRSLIESDRYVRDSDWSEAQPSTDDENAYLSDHSWEEYGRWFLAIDEDAGEKSKDRYRFPVGDFTRIHRSGLIAAGQLADEWDHSGIREKVLSLLEEVPESE